MSTGAISTCKGNHLWRGCTPRGAYVVRFSSASFVIFENVRRLFKLAKVMTHSLTSSNVSGVSLNASIFILGCHSTLQ
jgi:hypothetical protein